MYIVSGNAMYNEHLHPVFAEYVNIRLSKKFYMNYIQVN
jgi:hypothetical protein